MMNKICFLTVTLLFCAKSSVFANETPLDLSFNQAETSQKEFNYDEMVSRSRYWEDNVGTSKNEDEQTTRLNEWFLESLKRIRESLIFDQFPVSFQNEILFLLLRVSHPEFDYYGCSRSSTVAFTTGHSITLCDLFFKPHRTTAENLNTIIHEYVHMLGYDHGKEHSRRVQILYSLTAEIKGLSKNCKLKHYDQTVGGQVSSKKELIQISRKRFIQKIQKINVESAKTKWTYFLELNTHQ